MGCSLVHDHSATYIVHDPILLPTYSDLKNCHKIGEGVFGEVFLHRTRQRITVLKIIPIEGAHTVNGEPQKTFVEIYAEVLITKKLSDLRHTASRDDDNDVGESVNADGDFVDGGRHLPANVTDGFVELFGVRCVRGRYPQRLVDLWEEYDENAVNGSENDHPDGFGAEQLFIVLELANAGRDIESFKFKDANESTSALKQVHSCACVCVCGSFSFVVSFHPFRCAISCVFFSAFHIVSGSTILWRMSAGLVRSVSFEVYD